MTKKAANSAKKSAKSAQAPAGFTHADGLMAVALLPQLIEAFLASPQGKGNDWTATRLGKIAVGDPNKIFEMREGATLRPATAQKVIDVMHKAAPGFVKKFVRQQVKEATA